MRVPTEDEEQQLEAVRQFKQAQHLRIAAGDISGADRRRKGGTHGLEGSYGALVCFLRFEDLADGGLHYVAEPLELYPAAANRVIHAGAYQKDHARPAHYDAVKEGVYFYDKFHQ